MPIYEYRCAACGHHLEALQKMSEAPLRKCPECGKLRLKRLLSASRFRLKGSGWYETDFKSDAETKRNLVEKAGGEPSEVAAKAEGTKETADGAAKVADSAPAKSDGPSKTTKTKATGRKPTTASRKKPSGKARAAKSARA